MPFLFLRFDKIHFCNQMIHCTPEPSHFWIKIFSIPEDCFYLREHGRLMKAVDLGLLFIPNESFTSSFDFCFDSLRPSKKNQSCQDGSSWIESVLSRG